MKRHHYHSRPWHKSYARPRHNNHRRRHRKSSVLRTAKRVYYSWPSRTARRTGRSIYRSAVKAGVGTAWHGALVFARWFSRPWFK